MKILNDTSIKKLIQLIKSNFISNADTVEVTELSIDSAPTASSSNLVTSGGVHAALLGKVPTTDYNPDAKTSAMMQAVGKDSSGKLWTEPGSGGGGTWGSITGTLSDQADLQTALDAKGTYSKPSGGIPSTDMTSSVQTSLGKADSAFQDGDETYYTAAEIETLWAEVT